MSLSIAWKENLLIRELCTEISYLCAQIYMCICVYVYAFILCTYRLGSKCTKNPTLDAFCVYFNKHDS